MSKYDESIINRMIKTKDQKQTEAIQANANNRNVRQLIMRGGVEYEFLLNYTGIKMQEYIKTLKLLKSQGIGPVKHITDKNEQGKYIEEDDMFWTNKAIEIQTKCTDTALADKILVILYHLSMSSSLLYMCQPTESNINVGVQVFKYTGSKAILEYQREQLLSIIEVRYNRISELLVNEDRRTRKTIKDLEESIENGKSLIAYIDNVLSKNNTIRV